MGVLYGTAITQKCGAQGDVAAASVTACGFLY